MMVLFSRFFGLLYAPRGVTRPTECTNVDVGRVTPRGAYMLIFALLVAFSFSTRAASISADSMAGWPVLEGGRVMPLDSFARLKLLQFSGKSTYEKQPALDWLAGLMFDPSAAEKQQVFLVNHPEVMEALGVDPGDRRRFSFAEIHPGLSRLHAIAVKAFEIPDEDRSLVEKEILRVYHNLTQYSELGQVFSFAVPNREFDVTDAEVKKSLGLPEADAYSFLDIYLRASRMSDTITELESKKPSGWTDFQKQIFTLSSRLYQWSQGHRDLPIAVIPIASHGQEQWLSPWDVLSLGLNLPELRNDVASLQDVARHYNTGSQIEFDMAARTFERSVLLRTASGDSVRHLDLELKYNKYDLFYKAMTFYGLAFLVGMAGILSGWKGVRFAGAGLALIGVIPHTICIVWRMMIMGRPPMTNLYATFLFVAWVCVVLGLVIEWFQRNNLGVVLSGIAGLSLLLIANKFSTQGDTLGVVVAVLDSNFWLSTHVVSITIGYAGCVAAGIAGHIYLIQAIFKSPESPVLKSTMNAVYGLLAFGLIFSFLGTMLGGVWADQSWGRFWGWDPKENGALLIVLWTALLFHARIGRIIGPLGMAVGSVLGVIVVIFAWLGVNLLGVGLHSYGFTSGLARGMWISIGIELLFILVTVTMSKKSRVA